MYWIASGIFRECAEQYLDSELRNLINKTRIFLEDFETKIAYVQDKHKSELIKLMERFYDEDIGVRRWRYLRAGPM